MKNYHSRGRQIVPVLVAGLIGMTGCDDSITDFGFNGRISGTVQDQAGNPVRGNSATADLRVWVLGEGELEPLEIRVKHDGTYTNTHLFPQSYSLWIQGPVETTLTESSPATVNLTGSAVTHDITATPFMSIATPTVTQPTATSVAVTYNITPAAGRTFGNAIVWVSNASWPGPTTGSVVPDVRIHTASANLAGTSGTATVSNLRAGRKYYVRIGARATGTTLYNYSDQVEITTP